jgi:hypothetical protein
MIEEKFEDIIKDIDEIVEQQSEVSSVERRLPPNHAERISITEEGSKDIIESWFKEVDEIHNYDEMKVFICKLMNNYNHDYGTIIYAMTAGSLAAIKAMDRDEWEGGITGFQASCIMWEFMKRFMCYDGPMKLIQYKNLLYPQYKYHFEKTISEGTWRWLQGEAKKHLNSGHPMDPGVKAHMQSIVEGNVPFFFQIKEDE